MFSLPVGITFLVLYASIIFLIAFWVERKAAAGKNIGNNAYIYTLSFAVWFTAWSFYGQVGRAASSGMLYLTSHLGATLSIVLWWVLLRKMVRLRHEYRITSIADFISLRYNKSQTIAALATLIAIFGIVPYMALQLKAIIPTFELIVGSQNSADTYWTADTIGLLIAGFMVLFTILFGVRRVVPTERHQGMIVALAAENGVKLLAFLAVGIFTTYFLFNGIGDIFRQFAASPLSQATVARPTLAVLSQWTTNLLMAMSAVVFVPALFHIMVVENFHEGHIRTSMWLFPLFMFVFNLFVLPIAMAGLLAGHPVEQADRFVLTLPFLSGQAWLTWLVFLGGFSSAMGMLVVNAVTLSTMFSNHIVLPIVELSKPLSFLKRYLLQCRWIAVAAFIMASYWFQSRVVQSFMLAEIGVSAFVAVLQLAPTIIGGLFWKRANKTGAILGMSAGFLVWLYTLILPTFVRSGLISRSLLDDGPMHIWWLSPEHLFGVAGLDTASHAVLWSMFFNIGLYVLGSLCCEQSSQEQDIAEKFSTILESDSVGVRKLPGKTNIDRAEKKRKIEELLSLYFTDLQAAELADQCLSSLKLDTKDTMSIVELAELNNEVEKVLASSVGAAVAHQAIQKAAIFTSAEEEELKQAYAGIMTELRLPLSELVSRIDYYRERERLLTAQATEMEATIKERDQEIVERTLAQEALAQERERLAVTLRSIGDGVITTDIQGRVVLINNVAELLTGWKQEEAAGRLLDDIFCIVNQRTRLACESPVNNVIRSGGITGLANQTILIAKDGTERIIADSGAPIRDRESRIIGVVLVFRDVTDKERMEQELLRAQKLESVGILAGGIAHDFNNILTAILGNISIAKAYADPSDTIALRLEEAEKASFRARDLTRQLLTFAKGGAPIKRMTSVMEVIKDSALFALRGANVKCIFLFSDDLLPVEVDAGQISQVIHNMILNADQAMPEGGTVTISARNVVIKNSDTLPLRSGAHILLSIKDSGIGMHADLKDKIFDPYFTTKQEGSGLGLTSCYSIIKKHEGHITVESAPGEGATFHIYLPASGSTGAAIETGPDEKSIRQGKGKILLMDDDAMVRTIGRDIVELLGYDAECACDGKEAIDIYVRAKESGQPFDAVIMDLTVPGGMGGKDAVKHLLAIDPQLKAIVSSGYSMDPIMADFRAYGFCSVVAKPYKIEELSTTLHQVIGGA